MDGEAIAVIRVSGFLLGVLLMVVAFLYVLRADDSPSLAQGASPAAESKSIVEESQLELLSPNQTTVVEQTAGDEDARAVFAYRVWSPFRSRWAAEGFARRLLLATEVPVEVVNEGPDNYQVVFSYRDDNERQAMIAQIESVTGLELE